MNIIVMQIESDNTYTYVQSGSQASLYDRDTTMTFDNMKPGDYYMYVEFDWSCDHRNFVVSSYGLEAVNFIRNEASQHTLESLIPSVMKSFVDQNPKLCEKKEISKTITSYSYKKITDFGFSCQVIVNKDPSRTFY